MSERKLSGITVCIMYVLLIAACFAALRLDLVISCRTQAFVRELPIALQLGVANMIGLGPALDWLAQQADWRLPYATLVLFSFLPLYWLGWWIAHIDEEALSAATRAASVLPRGVQHCPRAEGEARFLIVGLNLTSNAAGGKPETAAQVALRA